MSDVRCRACGAAVPDQAQWCSLCFADLRPPAPTREPVSVPSAAGAAAADSMPAAGTVPARIPGAERTAPEPVATAAPLPPRTPQAPRPEPRWPCPTCGASVLLSLDACPDCGASFLAGATPSVGSRLPLVGDLRRMSQGQRMLVAAAIAVVLMIGFVLVAEIVGHVLG